MTLLPHPGIRSNTITPAGSGTQAGRWLLKFAIVGLNVSVPTFGRPSASMCA